MLDTTAHITVSLDDVNAANVADAPIGGTSDVGANRTVTLVITDTNGAKRDRHRRHRCRRQLQHQRDLSGLADGNLTVEASVTDAAGNRASATDDTSLLDTTAHITVSLDDVNAANVADAPIGGTSDVGANRTVTLVITDAKGASVTVTAVTDADGNYNTTLT
ncbi:hypothetical protein [Aeromonas rivipollensis]|uniref:hypothetical protein n=1 Tax=Aeromonas rivipollensis TaxID=948519 RepID=UPI000D125FCE|nr:hypothetical protein [Aeromonas rivipollensis]AVP95377.1 hypothetical protein C7N77_20890 [Aeromonas rivipollensis]